MSFILDALKKSDSERQRQSGPALFEIRKAPPRSGLPFWAIALGALLLVNLVAVVWFLARGPAPAVAPQPASTAAPPAAAPTVVPGSPAASAVANAPPQPGGTVPWAGAAPQAGTVPLPPPQSAIASPGLPPGAAIAPGAAVAPGDAAYAQPDYSGNPADYEQALPAGEGPSSSTLAAERNMVPTVDRLPPAIANQLPPLRLDLHVYATRATDRFVMVNMQRLREGDATPDGVRVEEITPTGAVMSFRGTRFQLEQR